VTSRVPALIVHGGAGADPGGRDELRSGMRDAVGAGWRALAAGGTALDPEVVAQLLARARRHPHDQLTPREREVLALMAEGLSNAGIAQRLVVTGGAVEKHVTSIFTKLGLEFAETDHRRVLAVLRYLEDRDP